MAAPPIDRPLGDAERDRLETLLDADTGLDDVRRGHLQLMHEQAGRMSRLIDDLLGYQRALHAASGLQIAALALDRMAGIAGADPAFGLIIALWLGWGAWKASSRAIEQLMDREWPEDKKARFVEVLGRHPELRGVHDLRTRTSGNRDFVQFHVSVDPDMTVRQVHDVMDEIEAKLHREFPDVEILIHPDPEGHVDPTDLSSEDLLAYRAS